MCLHLRPSLPAPQLLSYLQVVWDEKLISEMMGTVHLGPVPSSVDDRHKRYSWAYHKAKCFLAWSYCEPELFEASRRIGRKVGDGAVEQS